MYLQLENSNIEFITSLDSKGATSTLKRGSDDVAPRGDLKQHKRN